MSDRIGSDRRGATPGADFSRLASQARPRRGLRIVRLGGLLLWYRGIPRGLTGVEVVFRSRVFRRSEGREGVRKGEGVRTGEFKSGTSTTLNLTDQDLQTRTTRMKRLWRPVPSLSEPPGAVDSSLVGHLAEEHCYRLTKLQDHRQGICRF
jgi:hypothetical protein